LKAAFEEFISLQKNPPTVRLRIGNEVRMVRARLFLVNIVADGLANEQLVGRIQNRTTSPRLSRACHCPQHLADNYRLSCRYLRQKSLERLVVAGLGPISDSPDWLHYLNYLPDQPRRKAAERSLQIRKKISTGILKNVFGQHLVDLVWFHIDQGPDPRGCFATTSVDPMHAFEEGIVPYILSVILDPLSETAKSNLDFIALSIVSLNRWNSDYPRINFSGGFCSLTQLTADEKVGKLLLLLVILQTPLGQRILDKRCNESFDTQKAAIASRFESLPTPDEHDDSGDDLESRNSTFLLRNSYTNTPTQQAQADNVLTEVRLQFILPWLTQMSPYHVAILRKTVFIINASLGRGNINHTLPDAKFLERREIFGETTQIYYDDDDAKKINSTNDERPLDYAKHSLDCSTEQLKILLEMLLSFHAGKEEVVENKRQKGRAAQGEGIWRSDFSDDC
jgi:hypothetical protein